MTTEARVAAPVARAVRREAVLYAIGEYWILHGYAPAMRDLLRPSGLRSVSNVGYQMRVLRELGLVRFEDRVNRSLRLTVKGWEKAGLRPPCCKGERNGAH